MKDYNAMISKAHKFAAKYHTGQTYGKKSYIYHLMNVATLAVEVANQKGYEAQSNFTSCVNVVALLHDIIEDTDCTLKMINDEFGEEVSYVVMLLTKDKDFSYEVYIKNILTVEVARIVKIADTMHNLQSSMANMNMKRIKKYSKQLSLLTKD